MLMQSVTAGKHCRVSQSHQAQQPEDHVEDLRFGEEVLSKLDAGQCLQEGDGAARQRAKEEKQTRLDESLEATGRGHRNNIYVTGKCTELGGLTQTPSTGSRPSCTACP